MRRDFMFYTTLLLLSLGLAYYVSLPRQEMAADQKEWANVDVQSIMKIEWKSKDKNVALSRLPTKDFWAVVDDSSAPATKEDGKENVPANDKHSEFLVDNKILSLLKNFAPFVAQREIGNAADLKLEDYGLAADTAEFAIIGTSGDLLRLSVGKKAFGSRNTFVMDVKAKKVLLIEVEALESIEKAKNRLFEHKVMTTAEADVTAATLTAGERTKTFSHTKRDGAGDLIWGDAKKDTQAKNFFAQLFKLTVERYGSPADVQALAGLQPLVTVAVKSNGSTGTGDISFFKRSDATGLSYWVLHRANDVVAQISATKGDAIEKDVGPGSALFK